jgi:hypothetical protein
LQNLAKMIRMQESGFRIQKTGLRVKKTGLRTKRQDRGFRIELKAEQWFFLNPQSCILLLFYWKFGNNTK